MKIQKIAPGLLSLMGLKTMGNNPGELAETIAPTLELEQWFLQTNSVVLTGQVALAGPQDYNELCLPFSTGALANVAGAVIPQDEIWYVHQVLTRMFWTDAADYIQGDFGMAHFLGDGVDPVHLSNEIINPAMTAIAPASQYLQVSSYPRIWLPGGGFPGTHFGVVHVSAGLDIEGWMRVTRLKI